jgi:hypothetical protein
MPRKSADDSDGGASDEASDGSDFEEDDTDEEGSGGRSRSDGPPVMLLGETAGPVGGARVWDARNDPWTTEQVALFNQVWDGLNKPSWFVYPGHVNKLLRATAGLLRAGTPATRCACARGCVRFSRVGALGSAAPCLRDAPPGARAPLRPRSVARRVPDPWLAPSRRAPLRARHRKQARV